jgi:hypothetical protein
MRKFPLVLLVLLLMAGCSKAATAPPTTTTTTQPQAQGPIGPASGDIEYVCYDQGGSAVIPAVTNSAGTWSCPSSTFPYEAVASNSDEGVGQVPVGYHFICTNPNTGATYVASVGPFKLGGVSGYTGAYCPKASDDWLSVVP